METARKSLRPEHPLDKKNMTAKLKKIRKMKTQTAIAGWVLILTEVALWTLEWGISTSHATWAPHGNVWSMMMVMFVGIMALYVSYKCNRYLKRHE